MTILPALRVVLAEVLATRAGLGFGKPRAFRWRRVKRFSGSGGGVGSGDEMDDNELTDSGDEADADRSGVSRSSASTRMFLSSREVNVVSPAWGVLEVEVARELLFARFAAL